jgi:hypothetical protein
MGQQGDRGGTGSAQQAAAAAAAAAACFCGRRVGGPACQPFHAPPGRLPPRQVRAVLCGASKLREVADSAARLKAAGGGGRLAAVVYWGEPKAEALKVGAAGGEGDCTQGARAAPQRRTPRRRTTATPRHTPFCACPPQAVKAAVPKVMTWTELLAAGAAAPAPPQPPKPEDLCTIMYTSGTTGEGGRGRGGGRWAAACLHSLLSLPVRADECRPGALVERWPR